MGQFMQTDTDKVRQTSGAGGFGTTWWGRRWLEALIGIDQSNRIPRGQDYARRGMVYSFQVNMTKNEIKARVTGNYDPFYAVKIKLPQLNAEKKNAFLDAVVTSPLIIARLAARELDPSILEVADACGIKVFPEKME